MRSPPNRYPETTQPVWEEMTDAGSGLCYYFSSVSNSSQWYPPVWMDYLDPQVRTCVLASVSTIPIRIPVHPSIHHLLNTSLSQPINLSIPPSIHPSIHRHQLVTVTNAVTTNAALSRPPPLRRLPEYMWTDTVSASIKHINPSFCNRLSEATDPSTKLNCYYNSSNPDRTKRQAKTKLKTPHPLHITLVLSSEVSPTQTSTCINT